MISLNPRHPRNEDSCIRTRSGRNRLPVFRRGMKRALFGIVCLGCIALTGHALGDAGSEKPAISSLVGEWTLTLPLGDALRNPDLVIYQKNDNLKGWMKGPRGKMRLKKIEAEGNRFRFVQVIPMGGDEIKLTFEGTVQGNQLQGVINSKKLPKLPFTGIRKIVGD